MDQETILLVWFLLAQIDQVEIAGFEHMIVSVLLGN